MLETPCYIVGDAHLGVSTPDAEKSLIQFLRHVENHGRSLVIMGDLFDFWFSWKHVMPRSGFRVLAALADLHDNGIELLWLGGNHDCWGGKALEELTGVHYTLEAWQGEIGAWQSYLAHGDGLRDEEDAPYRRLRRVLRNPLAIRAYGWLHPDHATAIALASSRKSRDGRAKDEGRGLKEVARRQIVANPTIDLIVHGHTHVPVVERVESAWYANAGAWYLDQQYLRITGNLLERRVWRGSGEGDLLDAVNRVPKQPPGNSLEV